MTREQLAHLLRSASQTAEDPEILVVGSQSILGTFSERDLPEVAVLSMEADLAWFHDDADASKANAVDGAIGELSPFHELNSYYAQGVSVTTAKLPAGWRQRVVPYDTSSSQPATAVCLEPHDLVISKLLAHRSKDLLFATALLEHGLVDIQVLRERVMDVPDAEPIAVRMAAMWIEATARRLRQ